jgi:hypothetical protein
LSRASACVAAKQAYELDMARASRDASRKWRSALLSLWLASAGLTACATASQVSPPVRSAEQPNKVQDVSCRYVGLQDVSTAHDQNADQVSLLATYRFGAGVAPAKGPLALMFQVDRSRVSELGDYRAAQPEVFCSPEGSSHYAAKVTPVGYAPSQAHH